MRIALHATGEVGTRAGRILLAEPTLTALGLYGHQGRTEDRRTMAIQSLDGFGLLVTDDPAPGPLAATALDAGIPFVSAAAVRGRSLPRRFTQAGLTLLTHADLANGIAMSLATHEAARTDDPAQVVIAWTQEGRPLRRGIAVPFPDPVGARWARRRRSRPGRRRSTIELVAHVPNPWAGALARVTRSDDRTEQIVGVADHALHLAGIALAAGALAVDTGGFEPGPQRPSDDPTAYLSAALGVGLGVASYTLES